MEAIAFAVLIIAQPAAVIALQLYSQSHSSRLLSPLSHHRSQGPANRTDYQRGDRSCLLTDRPA